MRRMVRFDTLGWSGTGPLLERADRFAAGWDLVSGQLFFQPTFRDRPAARGGASSNVEGRWWVNTAEAYAGPFGGCATCAPAETLTGILRSAAFTLAGERIELRVGGTASALCRVALVDSASGAVLHEARGLGSEAMTLRSWFVAPYLGRRAVIEIADLDPAGHVSVDAIAELGDAVAAGLDPAPGRRPGLLAVPNPSHGEVRLAWEGGGEPARLAVYDVTGRLVRRLERRAGRGFRWDGRNDDGAPVAAGTYLVRSGSPALPGGGPVARICLLR
jgi:hypothetical protein